MGRYDTLLEDPKKATPQPELQPSVKKQTGGHTAPKPVVSKAHSKSSSNESKHASTISNTQEELIETLRKTVKRLGKEVTYVRLTPEEKTQLADIIYTYKRQGTKTSENEIARIGLNYLIADYQANGEESVLAKVIAALNA